MKATIINTRKCILGKITTYKGGSGSGDFGHSGRPGEVGGNGSGVRSARLHMPTSYNKKNIGEILDKARNNLLTASPNSQQSLPKPGVTREQLKQHYKMVNLYKQATSGKYAYQPPGDTIADYIDKNFLNKGFTEIVKEGNHYILHKPDKPAERVLVRDKAGIAYVKLLEMLSGASGSKSKSAAYYSGFDLGKYGSGYINPNFSKQQMQEFGAGLLDAKKKFAK